MLFYYFKQANENANVWKAVNADNYKQQQQQKTIMCTLIPYFCSKYYPISVEMCSSKSKEAWNYFSAEFWFKAHSSV